MGKRRLIFLFVLISSVFLAILARLLFLSQADYASKTGETHGSYSITVARQRGTIYDSSLRPLVNESEEYLAAVSPLRDLSKELSALMPHVSDSASVLAKIQQGKPFLAKVDSCDISADGIAVTAVKKRYSGDAVAPHVIGYLDSTGKGVSGIEKAFDDVLSEGGGTVTANFAVDAKGRTLEGVGCKISVSGGNSPKSVDSGVVLTIDRDIQVLAQKAAQRYLKAGAVVVMDVKTGDILASVSVPAFSQTQLSSALKTEDSPLLNRAFSSYDVGSVFKIAVAAAALESGISPDTAITCNGKISVSGKKFTCEKSHGLQTMGQAMANSCNIYFISIGQLLGGGKILNMAEKLGFGKAAPFAPGYSASAGVLPAEAELSIPAALANFSFGQGDFMATPVQVARMICSVANGGMLPAPRLVKSIVDSDKRTVKEYPSAAPVRVFSQNTASVLSQFLIQTVESGTGRPAKPQAGGAGGKTSTAQTGWLKNGKAINQAWFAGFYPASSPRYAVAVIAEAGVTGGSSAGPVFREIADGLAPSCGYSVQQTK